MSKCRAASAYAEGWCCGLGVWPSTGPVLPKQALLSSWGPFVWPAAPDTAGTDWHLTMERHTKHQAQASAKEYSSNMTLCRWGRWCCRQAAWPSTGPAPPKQGLLSFWRPFVWPAAPDTATDLNLKRTGTVSGFSQGLLKQCETCADGGAGAVGWQPGHRPVRPGQIRA